MNYDTETFLHNGKEYEVRIVSDGLRTNVRAFLDGKPANGYSHSVDLHVDFSFTKKYGYSLVKELIDTARAEVINGQWERYLAAINQTK